MAREATRHGPALDNASPRDRRNEPRALDLNATSTRHKLTPTRLLGRPLSVFTVSPLTTRLPLRESLALPSVAGFAEC